MRMRLFLVLLAATCGLVAASPRLRADDAPETKTKTFTLAHIKLAATSSEAPVAAESLFGGSEENFKSKLDRIKKAKKDAAVGALLPGIRGPRRSAGARSTSCATAIADFRKIGQAGLRLPGRRAKRRITWSRSPATRSCMPEAGWLMLTGMRAEISFYKDLFDWVGVKADMLQMGDFKGAAEPYTRSGMSKEFRQQLETVIDDYYEKSYVNTIVRCARSKSGRRSR